MSVNGEYAQKPEVHVVVHFGDTAASMILVVECPTSKTYSSDTLKDLIKKFQQEASKEGSGYSLEGSIQWDRMNYDVTCKSSDQCEELTSHVNFWNSWESSDIKNDDCCLIRNCVGKYVGEIFSAQKVRIILMNNGKEFECKQCPCSCTSS